MNARIVQLNNAIVRLELLGAWYTAQILRQYLARELELEQESKSQPKGSKTWT